MTENEQIIAITKIIKSRNITLPTHFTDGDILRFLHLSKNKIEKTVNIIEIHINWIKKISDFRLTQTAQNMIKNGHIYIGGRCKQSYPILVLNFAEIALNEELIID